MRSLWILALLAVLSTALAPQAFASWVCEGRTCGTTLLCCCTSPEPGQDANCNQGSGAQAGASTTCATECECVLTVSNLDSAGSSQPNLYSAPIVAAVFLPYGVTYVAPAPAEKTPHVGETRGPPVRSLCLFTPVLRGPPVLTFPVIGV